MTYVDTTQRDEYTATSLQTVFAYTFRILTEAELIVYNDGVLQTLTTHYTVSGVGTAGGGNVTFVTGVTLNNVVIIIRNTPDTQSADYTVGGPFSAETHEKALDKLAMKSQDLDEKLGRAVKAAITSLLSDIDFPEGSSASDRAGKVWAWDSAGTGMQLLAATIVDAVSVIAVKGDIVQGGTSGGAEKLAVGVTGDMLTPVSGKLAYDFVRNLTTSKGSDIPSATALVIPDSKDNYWDVTGTTTITSISATNLAVGSIIRLHFDGALTLTHHSTDLVLPNTVNITTIAGDEATFLQYATDDYRLISFIASGQPVRPPHNYRSGLNCVQSAAGTLTVESGTVEIDGVLGTISTDTILTIATASFWVDDTSHLAASTWFYIYVNAAGTLELDDQAPDASDTSDNTSGLLRYNNTGVDTSWRRCIGKFITNSTSTLDTYGSVMAFDEVTGLVPNGAVVLTSQTTSSGTTFDFTVPLGVKKITLMFANVSLSGTDQFLVQIGDTGGIETAGYASVSGSKAGETGSTSGFVLGEAMVAAAVYTGSLILTLGDVGSDTWGSLHTMSRTDTPFYTFSGGGTKALTDPVTTIRLTTTGSNTFDSGAVNIQYE